MSDDDFLSQFIADVERLAVDARRIKRDRSLDARFRAREFLSMREAAVVALCSDETIRRACVRTKDRKDALGTFYEGRWFVDTTRLLDWIGRRGTTGPTNRRNAMERIRNLRRSFD
jgi:hypothetical protein